MRQTLPVYRPKATPTPPEPEIDAPAQPVDSDAMHHARQLVMLRRMADLGMELAEAAVTKAKQPDPETGKGPDYNLAFVRVTQAVREAIDLENRIISGQVAAKDAAPRLPLLPDTRRGPLRKALYKLTDGEPDRGTRTQLRAQIDQRIEEQLLGDPGHKRPLADPYMEIAQEFSLPADLSKVSDEFLGMRPARRFPEPAAKPPEDPADTPLDG